MAMISDKKLVRGLLLTVFWGMLLNLFLIGFSRSSFGAWVVAIIVAVLLMVAFGLLMWRVWQRRWPFVTTDAL